MPSAETDREPELVVGPSSETGLFILLQALWRYKWIPLSAVVVLVLVGTLRLYGRVPVYSASAVIYPSTEIDPRRQVTTGGGLAFLESGRGPPTPFDKFLAVMRTPEFAAEMDHRLNLAKRLFPGAWDETTQRWRERDDLSATIERALGWQIYPADPVRLLNRFLSASLVVVQADKRVSLTTISFDATDRQLAQDVLTTALQVAQQILIDREESQLGHDIDYLEAKLQTVQLVEHRQELSKLLSDQEREMMLLKAGNYGASVLQPVYTPPTPDYPSLRITMIIAVALGVMIGSVIAFVLALRDLSREP